MARARGGGARLSASLQDLVELRLRLAWRRLRGPGGTAHGVAQVALFLVAVPAALLFAGLLGAGSFRAARSGRGLAVTVSLGAMIFGLWQTWTAIGLTMAEREALDLKRLLVYPVSPRRLYAVGVAASVIGDPFSLVWSFLLCGILAGALAARPGAWVLLLAVTLALFAAATAALVALVQEVLERWSRSRLWRELALAAGLVGWVALAMAATGEGRSWRAALSALKQVRWVAYPPALALEAAVQLYAGRPAAALPWLAALAAAATLTGAAAYRLAYGTARSGGEPAARPARAGPGRLLARLPPLLEKELRYLSRHPAARVYALALPLLAALVGWRPPLRLAGDLAPLGRALPLFFLALYVHLGFQAFWVNAFAWERGGARLLYLAPVRAERLLAAKNAALLAASTGVFALSSAAYLGVARAADGWAIGSALALHLGVAPLLYAAGNAVSVLWPRAAPSGFQRGAVLSPLAALAAIGITSATAVVFGAPVLLAVWLEQLWLIPAGWVAAGLSAWVLWAASLGPTARLFERRREQLLAAVTGDVV